MQNTENLFLTAILPAEPGLTGFIVARIMEVVVTTGAIRREKRQSNHRHQQTNTQLLGRMFFLASNQQCHSTKGKEHQKFIIIISGFGI